MKKVLFLTLTLALFCTSGLIDGLLSTSYAHAASYTLANNRVSTSVKPLIALNPGPCNGLPLPWVELDSPSKTECISGYGYIGLGSNDLPHTADLIAEGSGGWIRYYTNTGGYFCNFGIGTYYLGSVYVTQVDIGGTQSGAPSC
jgi:hypothetical protein